MSSVYLAAATDSASDGIANVAFAIAAIAVVAVACSAQLARRTGDAS